VTQVAHGVGGGGTGRSGASLPLRIHELLLDLAGRLDDDALTDARQMLASTELDRSLEFIAGCLVAGKVVLNTRQQQELEALFADTYQDVALLDRVVARDQVNAGRHRFVTGAVGHREPDQGVAQALRPVLDVLPDVRSVWCVWRVSPAGPTSGPVPHRVVIVGVGPDGVAPATAYRVEDALRRAGIRASVEVLVDGAEPPEYHKEAMRCARQVPFADAGLGGPASPVTPPAPQDSWRDQPDEPSWRSEPSFSQEEPPRSPVADAPRVEVSRANPPWLDTPRAEPSGPDSFGSDSFGEPPRGTSTEPSDSSVEPFGEPDAPRPFADQPPGSGLSDPGSFGDTRPDPIPEQSRSQLAPEPLMEQSHSAMPPVPEPLGEQSRSRALPPADQPGGRSFGGPDSFGEPLAEQSRSQMMPAPEQSHSAMPPVPEPLAEQSRSRMMPAPDPHAEQSRSQMTPAPGPLGEQSRSRALPPADQPGGRSFGGPDSFGEPLAEQSRSQMMPAPEQSHSAMPPVPEPLAEQSRSRMMPAPDPHAEQSRSQMTPAPGPLGEQSRSRALPPADQPGGRSFGGPDSFDEPLAEQSRSQMMPASEPHMDQPRNHLAPEPHAEQSRSQMMPAPGPLGEQSRSRALPPAEPLAEQSRSQMMPSPGPLGEQSRSQMMPPAGPLGEEPHAEQSRSQMTPAPGPLGEQSRSRALPPAEPLAEQSRSQMMPAPGPLGEQSRSRALPPPEPHAEQSRSRAMPPPERPALPSSPVEPPWRDAPKAEPTRSAPGKPINGSDESDNERTMIEPIRPIDPQYRQEAPEEPKEKPRPRPSPRPKPSPQPSPQPPSALSIDTPTGSAPPPKRPQPKPAQDDKRVDRHAAAFGDDMLNTQERNLLKELQDELARREQAGSQSGAWQIDKSGRHGKPASAGPFDQPTNMTRPVITNGKPRRPEQGGY
jgi:hypothetical protein